MTSASDRARGNSVQLNGHALEDAGAFAPDTLNAPEVALGFTARRPSSSAPISPQE